MATVTVDGANYDLTNGLVTNELDEYTFADLNTASVQWGDWDSWDGFGLPTGISIPSTLTFNTRGTRAGYLLLRARRLLLRISMLRIR